jgi:hypothetical protein
MDDLEQQLRAWTDASEAAAAADPVTAEQAMALAAAGAAPAPVAAGAGWRGRRTWLAAAVVLVALAVGGAVMVIAGDGGDEPVQTGELGGEPDVDPEPQREPDPPIDGVLEPFDGFEVLHMGLAGDEPVGTIRAARTDEQLAELWDDLIVLEEPTGEASPVGPPPSIDHDEVAVVSLVLPDSGCAPYLEEIDLAGVGILVPDFRVPEGECGSPQPPKRYVVAIEWASVGADVRILLPAGSFPGIEGSELRLRRDRPDPVLIDLELAGRTVVAGDEVPGTVIVSNATGEPIDIGFCGAEFAVGLANDEVEQALGFEDCLETGTIPPGTSTYGVVVRASYGSCVAGTSEPPTLVACLPEGGVPPLPAGEYRTRVYPPSGLDDFVAPALTVTVTDP